MVSVPSGSELLKEAEWLEQRRAMVRRVEKLIESRERFSLEDDTSPEFDRTTEALCTLLDARKECAREREHRMELELERMELELERKLERAKEDAEEALSTLHHATHHNWSPKVEWAEALLARIVSGD